MNWKEEHERSLRGASEDEIKELHLKNFTAYNDSLHQDSRQYWASVLNSTITDHDNPNFWVKQHFQLYR